MFLCDCFYTVFPVCFYTVSRCPLTVARIPPDIAGHSAGTWIPYGRTPAK